jgi:hypothetical protein
VTPVDAAVAIKEMKKLHLSKPPEQKDEGKDAEK